MSNSAQLRLLKQFKCLAEDCPDDCCHDWNTHVDKQTLDKWQAVPQQAKRDYLLSTVQQLEQQNNEAVLVRKDSGQCIHLDERGLCAIQDKYSPDYLPLTCQVYPREEIVKNQVTFQTAHLSCPAIIDLLSQSPSMDLLDNEQALYQASNLDIISQLSCTIHRYMQGIFQTSELYLGLKIYAISRILAEIMQLALEDTLTTELIHQQYPSSPESLAATWLSWQNQSHNDEFAQSQTAIRHFLQQVNTSVLSKYRAQFEAQFGVTVPNLSLTRFFKWREQVDIQPLEPFLEKYIRVKFLNHGFPWNPIQNNHAATFLDCLISLVLCHHLLIAFDLAGIEVDQTKLKQIVWSVERLNGHSNHNIRLVSLKPELLNISEYNLLFTLLV